MPRTALLTSAAAVLAAASVGVGVIGSPVGSASAAAPFSITKSQYQQVKKTATGAMKKANDNAKQIKALQSASAAAAGVQGPKGDPGGFDPAKVTRVTGPSVPVLADDPYTGYSLDCPAGTIALSGGHLLSSTANEKLFRLPASYPHSDLGGWSYRFSYSAAAGTVVNVTPYVVCAAS